MSIGKLVPTPIHDTDHADAILEVAFLMSAVDGHLADEELAAFKELIAKVRGKSVAPKEDLDNLLERFVVAAHTVGVDERVREVAKTIPKELREMAFKIAVGLSLVDHEESEFEDEMVGTLGAAFELGERAITLAKEASAAIAD